MNSEFADAFSERVPLLMAERDEPFAASVVEVGRKFRGATGRRLYGVALGDLYANELQARGGIIWGELLRVAEAFGVYPTGENDAPLGKLVLSLIDAEAVTLLESLTKEASFASGTMDASVTQGFERVRHLTKSRALADLRLWKAQVANKPARDAAPANFSGAYIGSVVIGDNATTHVTQTINREVGSRLIDSLEDLARQIDDLPATQRAADAEQIKEAIALTVAELRKPRPSGLTIRGMLIGIGGAVRFVAALRPAYETIKGLAAQVGAYLT